MSDNIRDYEVSVWTLQDSYITTLKWSNSSHKGLILNPKMTLSDDGTESFSFSIPMYLFVLDGDVSIKTENPLWYATRDNNIIIKDMRKIKVIFNKTFGSSLQKKAANERVFEFLIVKVEDSHEEDNPKCNVECEGLAFHELGKLGYKVELSSDVFLNRWNSLYDVDLGACWYDNLHYKHEEIPFGNLDYWMNDLGILNYTYANMYDNGTYKGFSNQERTATERNSTQWYYQVLMDYSAFSDDENGEVRDPTKIYEDTYTCAWTDELTPVRVKEVHEKERMVDASESNFYNLTLTIAETFGVFCRYEYEYDDVYHITGRKIIFYNNFVKDTEGEKFEDLTYPYSTTSVSRELDSTDITTKMYVRPSEDASAITGLISIIDTTANATGEDYILNFEYLHNIGTISDEQYAEIEPFRKKMREFNYGKDGVVETAEQNGLGVTISFDKDKHLTVSNYTGSLDEGTVAIINEIECIYTNEEWHLREDGDSIQGIVGLLELLIAKADDKIELEAKLKVATREKELAKERLSDAREHITNLGSIVTRDENNPVTLVPVLDSSRPSSDNKYYYQVNFPSDHTGIVENSIKLYREYESSKHIFNLMLPLDLPSRKTLELPENWNEPSANIKKAISTYNKLYKSLYSNDPPDDEKPEVRFKDWITEFNDGLHEKSGIPKLQTGNISNTTYRQITCEDEGAPTYNIFKDSLAWIACILGIGTIKRVKYKNQNKKEKFNDIVLNSLKINGKTYSLAQTTSGNIEKTSWNNLVLARRALCAIYLPNIKESYVSFDSATLSNTFTPGFIKTSSSTSNLYVTISLRGVVQWNFSHGNLIVMFQNSLEDIWNAIKNASWHSYTCYDQFLGEEFGVDWGVNSINNFLYIYDSENKLTGLNCIFTKKKLPNYIYATYSYSPDTYYKEVADMWHKKIMIAEEQEKEYTLKLLVLLIELELLEFQIRTKLLKKFNTIREFDHMMGPALRESYWQPENYLNYGDLYVETPNRVYFSGDNATVKPERENSDLISSLFFWDDELFSWEDKDYYEVGVNLDKEHYPCINLKSFFDEQKSPLALTAFLDNLQNVSFSFYNDSFDKLVKQLNGSWKYQDNIWTKDGKNWYYKRVVDYGTQGTSNLDKFYDEIEVVRTEADRVIYMNGASMKLAFLKDKYKNKIIPVLMMLDMNDLPESVFHFVTQLPSMVVTSTNTPILIHPGAQPSLGLYLMDGLSPLANVDNLPLNNYMNSANYADDFDDSNTISATDTMVLVDGKMPGVQGTVANDNMELVGNLSMTSTLTLSGDTVPRKIVFLEIHETFSNDTINAFNSTVGVNYTSEITDYDNNTNTLVNINPIVEEELSLLKFLSFGTVLPKHWINWDTEPDRYTIVYPRIEINSLLVKTAETHLYENQVLLNTPEHYSLFSRGNNYYLNIKPEVLFTTFTSKDNDYGVNIVRDECFNNSSTADDSVDKNELRRRYPFDLLYNISNGGTYVYRDAILVLLENSVPKVSYTVTPNILRKKFISALYNKLGQIVMINDFELKFDNVFGYISSLELDLDHYWEDSIEVKNYKNKFEDLFSSISAETEEMKKNGTVISNLSSGIISGNLSYALAEAVDDAIIVNNVSTTNNAITSIVDAYLSANFDGPEVVEELISKMFKEANEALAAGADGLIDLANLTEKNAAMLSGFMSNIAKLTTPTIFYGSPSTVSDYKPGDIIIDGDGTLYIASSYSTILPFYTGSTNKITGANLDVDADAGIINIEGENEINIKSGNDLLIAADATVTIIGNKEVNIGGCTINIGSGVPLDATETIWDDVEEQYIEVPTYETGGINIVSGSFSSDGAITGTSSGVFILPKSIEMLSSNIFMRGSKRIMMAVSTDEPDGITPVHTSGIQIDRDNGIFIGSGKGIEIYSGHVVDGQLTPEFELSYDDNGDPRLMPRLNIGTSVSIHPDRILLGATTGAEGVSVKITPSLLVIGASNSITALGDTDTPALNNEIVGAIFSAEKIALATKPENQDSRNLILMDNNGIFIGAGTSINTGNHTGSYVNISSAGVDIGSNGNLYVNTNNFKILTSSTGTILAIGSNLLGISSLTTAAQANRTSTVSMLITNSTAYFKGTIYADSGEFKGSLAIGTTLINNVSYSNFKVDASGKVYIGPYNSSTYRIYINPSASGTNEAFRIGIISGALADKYILYLGNGTLNIAGNINALSGQIGSWSINEGLEGNVVVDTLTNMSGTLETSSIVKITPAPDNNNGYIISFNQESNIPPNEDDYLVPRGSTSEKTLTYSFAVDKRGRLNCALLTTGKIKITNGKRGFLCLENLSNSSYDYEGRIYIGAEGNLKYLVRRRRKGESYPIWEDSSVRSATLTDITF